MPGGVAGGYGAFALKSYTRLTAIGRSEPVDFDVAVSGTGSTAAAGRAGFCARTRRESDLRSWKRAYLAVVALWEHRVRLLSKC